ncbi:hypothetical protein H5410_061165 [Solanum commersonii]|uniref:Uncharacterized protein n=1 Tax=Solanum commersonii TaxID=4109 RepID=A0A9J5W7U1_SOLCO|nr:hypothetical protein H5410_061165 [Solanum commersonii]
MGLEITFCSSVLRPEGKGQVGDEMDSLRVTDFFCETAINQPNGGSLICSAIQTKCTEWSSTAQIFNYYKYLFKFLRGRKAKTTILITSGIGSTWVLLERVNPSPSPTHSVQESE